MGIIYSAGMSCNSFDVAPEHGRTPFYVDAKHDGLVFILRNQKTLVIRRII